MTIRSMLPASSHFAERPVPAPPPTIGSPRATMARNFFKSSARSNRGIDHLATRRRVPGRPISERKAVTAATANSGSLMLHLRRISCRLLVWRAVWSSARNSVASTSRSRNGCPGASSAETPPSGRKNRTGPSIALRRWPIQAPAFVLLGSGAHERHLRIVDVQVAAAVALGDGFGGAEIDHIERADRTDIGDAGADDGAEAILGRRGHPAHQETADFTCRYVGHACQQTGIYQLLHRAAADAGGMEDEAFVIAAQRRRNLLHGGRGDA